MASSRGLFTESLEKLRNLLLRRQLVGTDVNGNRYYKWTETLNGEIKERRQVRVKGGDVLYNPKIVPPEWRAWLAKTRQEAPTEDEMARSSARAAVMAQRVAVIEERERQRRYRLDSLGQAATPASGPDVSRLLAQLQGDGAQQDPLTDGSAAAAADAAAGQQQQQQQQQRD